jgi:hypothetical protein
MVRESPQINDYDWRSGVLTESISQGFNKITHTIRLKNALNLLNSSSSLIMSTFL